MNNYLFPQHLTVTHAIPQADLDIRADYVFVQEFLLFYQMYYAMKEM